MVSKTDREGASPSGPASVSWRLGRSSDGAWLKTTRARRATASLHHFHIAGSGESAAGLISRLFSVQLGILLPLFSERSLEVRHSAWDRDHACANPAAPTNFVYQVCGSVSGAPAREAGEAGANPAHLTTARGDEVVESALCRREVSRCESDHERQFYVEVSPSSYGSWPTPSLNGGASPSTSTIFIPR